MSEHLQVVSGVAARARSLMRERPWPVYPLLVGAYFVLFLYSVNLEEAELGDLVPVLLVVVALIGFVLLGVGLLTGNIQRAALALSAVLVAVFAYEHVRELLAPIRIGPVAQQLIWLAVIAATWIVAWRTRRWLAPVTRALNVLTAVLVTVTLIVIVPYQMSLAAGNESPPTAPVGSDAPPASGVNPDIVYLVFDRYPSERSLELNYGIENDLYDELRDRGFYVAERSHANYQRTSMSMASTLSAELLDRRGRASEVWGPTDMSGPYSRIQNSNVARFLKSRGYNYIHVGSDFSGTQTSPLADVNPRYDSFSDFGRAFLESTALPGIARTLGLGASRWERRYNWTQWELDQLESLADLPGPTFVLGHVLLPHTPYIFDADGTFISDPAAGRSRQEQFEDQLRYTNTRLLRIVDHFLDRPPGEQPLLIVQADEGPYPKGLESQTGHDWRTATPEEREIKFGILNAWHVPDGKDIGLYPEISSVNTFRLLFNAYFDTDLELLPDDSFTSGQREPLTFPAWDP
jgi:hypothetical protein